MKRIVSIVTLVLVLGLGTSLKADPWLTSGFLSGPVAANTVLIDFGASDDTTVDLPIRFDLIASSSATLILSIQRVDVDGTTVLKEQPIVVPVGTQRDTDLVFTVNTGQRIRIVVRAAFASGQFAVSAIRK